MVLICNTTINVGTKVSDAIRPSGRIFLFPSLIIILNNHTVSGLFEILGLSRAEW